MLDEYMFYLHPHQAPTLDDANMQAWSELEKKESFKKYLFSAVPVLLYE